MRDGGRRARVASKAFEPLLGREFHSICGKFCVQVISGARKALVYRMLPAFEPKRSIYPNRLNTKGLEFSKPHDNRMSVDGVNQIKFAAISTVGGN